MGVAILFEIVKGEQRYGSRVVPVVRVDIIDCAVPFQEVIQAIEPESVVDESNRYPLADPQCLVDGVACMIQVLNGSR